MCRLQRRFLQRQVLLFKDLLYVHSKAAMLVKDHHPDIDVTVFYIDVRTPGKNFDEFYRRAVEQYGVHYIKGMVGKVEQGQGCLKASGF